MLPRDQRWAFHATGLVLADADGQGRGGPEPGRRGAGGGRRGEGASARVRVRERRGFLRSRRRERERFSRGERSGAIPWMPGPGEQRGMARGSHAPGALHWGGYRANSFASLRASVSPFPPSDIFPHPPRGWTRGGLPTWPARLRLCFPPRRDAATGPFPKGRAREAPRGCHRSWTRAGKKVASMQRDLSHGRTKGGKRSVTLVRALETRTNPAAASEAKFLAHLMILLPGCGRGHRGGTEPVLLPREGCPVCPLDLASASPQTFTETQRWEPVERIWRCVKKL